ncbi:MAG: chemotaxis protein CheD [Gemmatimonas sp.]
MKQIRVNIADYAVSAAPITLATIGLGSCVAIVLHDARAGIGAMAHVLLPNEALSTQRDLPGKFASTAVPAMLTRMRELGARDGIGARLVGGSSMFGSLLPAGAFPLGTRNIAAARAACLAHGIPVVAEDVGGSHGRSVYLDVKQGSLFVRSLAKGDVSL